MRFPIPLHSVLEQLVYLATRTVVRMLPKLGDCLTLLNNPRIVCSLVLVGYGLCNTQRFFGSDTLIELIGERQKQEDECCRIVGFNYEDVPTDTLSLSWLIKKAVPFCL